jgi:hypothetical protein
MRSVQDIYFDVTSQLVYLDATEGRPTSVTSVDVYPWDASDEQTPEDAVGSGSVETSPSTTIDAASGYGQTDPRKLNVTATTGFVVGRSYLVTSADGLYEWFTCSEIDPGNYVIAAHPLHNAYASADTVQSTRIQATIDSTWVADSSNLTADEVGPNPMYRVRWVYVVGGVTHVADSYFNLVRYAGRHGVLPQDIEDMYPGWLDRLPTDHRNDQGRRLIADAYRGVKIDLHQIDMTASAVAESEVVDELVRYKAIELGESAKFLGGGSGVDPERAKLAAQRYTQRLDSLLRIVARVPVRDETGAATPVIAVGLTRR